MTSYEKDEVEGNRADYTVPNRAMHDPAENMEVKMQHWRDFMERNGLNFFISSLKPVEQVAVMKAFLCGWKCCEEENKLPCSFLPERKL